MLNKCSFKGIKLTVKIGTNVVDVVKNEIEIVSMAEMNFRGCGAVESPSCRQKQTGQTLMTR